MGKKRRSRAFKESNQVIDFEEERQNRREKRKQLTDKRKGRQRPDEAPVSGRRTSKKVKRRLIYAGVMLAVCCMIGYSAFNVISLRADRAEAQAANEALIKERDKLQKELSLVDSDEYIEEVARDELHMIKNGEKIYVLPDENLTEGALAASTTDEAVTGPAAAAPDDGFEPGVLDKLKEFGSGLLEDAKAVAGAVGDNLKSLLRK